MKFNIAPLDKAKLIQVLYAYASPKTVIKNEYSSFVNSGEPVKTLTLEECKAVILKNKSKKSGWGVNAIHGKPLKIKAKRISDSLVVMESAPYDLMYGRYRLLQALIAMFHPRDIYILDIHYDSAFEAAIQKLPVRSREETFQRSLENAVLTTDEHYNPHWTLNTPMHELASALGANKPGDQANKIKAK